LALSYRGGSLIEKIFQKKTLVIDNKLAKNILIFGLPVILYIVLISIGLAGEGSQQFSLLANSFVHGHTYFLQSIGGVGQDPVLYHGKIYWDEGAFPAVILMPFVAFFNIWHIFFFQGYIKWLLILLISYLLYKMARKIGFSLADSYIWMFGFVLGSVFMGVGSVSSGWLFAQVVATLLALWALYEYMNSRRWWLIGLITTCLLLTRLPAAAILVFYLLVIVLAKTDWKTKRKHLFQLLIFIFIGFILMGLYNWQRFGGPLNNGNQYQLLSEASSDARAMGVFSLDHIPTNLYTLILRAPTPVLANNNSWSLKAPWIDNNNLGVSVFITSPWLLYLFTKRWIKYPKEAKYLVIASMVGLLLVLSYFGDGADQLGYRYTLDFMPGLFLALMMLYRKNTGKLTTGMKILLLGSGLTNFYLLVTYIK
jgi:energy-coupling factor transporter transmembrane protein EcfT